MQTQQKALLFFIVSLISFGFCTLPAKDVFTINGRTETLPDNSIALISPASSVTFGFKGEKCSIKLRSQDTYEHYNYAVIEVDGQYYSRNKITPAGTIIMVSVNGSQHVVTVYKATEAANGQVVFTGAEGTLYKAPLKKKKKIAFVGDSITCGMGNDLSEVPCGIGEWYDQHNAYYSYAPIAARTLGADYVLSSVSGIGMYRNWNDEHDKEAIMPDVYENLYLNKDTSKKYDFAFLPDVTCIALGTNDFSDGDGKKPRLPFNEDKYVSNYIAFINMVYKHAPQTQLVLLTSPMVTGAKAATFEKCLNRIKDAVNKQAGHKPVQVFTFTSVIPQGCGSHPDIENDKAMAAQLAPFIKPLLK